MLSEREGDNKWRTITGKRTGKKTKRTREKVRRIKLIFGIDAALVLVLLLILAVSKGMSAGSGEKETSAKAGAAGTEAGQDKDMVPK